MDLVPEHYHNRLIALVVANGNARDAFFLRREVRWVELWEIWGAQKALAFEERKLGEEREAAAKAKAKLKGR